MPRSFLLFIVAAVAGLGILTWYQFFRAEPEAPPKVAPHESSGKNESPGKQEQQVEPPPQLPVGVPLDVRARELLERLVRRILNGEDPIEKGEMDWLRNTEEGVAELRRIIQDSRDDNVRAVALLTLGQSKLDGTFDDLKAAASGKYGDALRTAAIIGMTNGQEQSIPTLREVFVQAPDEGVAAASLQALSHLDYDAALGAFADLMSMTSEEDRRDTLYQILGGHHFPRETDEPEVMVTFRRELAGMMPPEPDPDPLQSKVIDDIVDQVVREDDPKLWMSSNLVLTRMPGQKAQDAFVGRYRTAGREQRMGMLTLLHPGMSRGKINAFLRMAPEMESREERNLLSQMAFETHDHRILGELRIWRDREEDPEIRSRLDEKVRQLEGR